MARAHISLDATHQNCNAIFTKKEPSLKVSSFVMLERKKSSSASESYILHNKIRYFKLKNLFPLDQQNSIHLKKWQALSLRGEG